MTHETDSARQVNVTSAFGLCHAGNPHPFCIDGCRPIQTYRRMHGGPHGRTTFAGSAEQAQRFEKTAWTGHAQINP